MNKRNNLNKIIPLVIIGFILSSGVGLARQLTTLNDSEHRTCVFSNLAITTQSKTVTLDLDGTNTIFSKPGFYQVPMKVETFTFPVGTVITDVTCTPNNVHSRQLSHKLPVASYPIAKDGTFSTHAQFDTPQTIKTWFKYHLGMGLDENNQRRMILSIQLFPIQYTPETNTINYAQSIEINVNYLLPKTQPRPTEPEYKFIIISPDAFISALTPLLNHKTTVRNIPTKIITLNEIYNGDYFQVQGRDNQEKIKYFIKNSIENWGTTDVLLVGGINQVPARRSHIHVEGADPYQNEIIYTDVYYADIYNNTNGFSSWDTNNNSVFGEYDWGSTHDTDEIDLYPDIAIGRLACVQQSEVTDCVNKIIQYETTKAYKQSWFKKMIVIGGDSFCPPDVPEDIWGWNEGEEANKAALQIMTDFTSDKIWDTNARLSSTYPMTGVQEITNSLNQGSGFVFFSGHGSEQLWSTHPHNNSRFWIPTPLSQGAYTSANVASLTNGNKLPIVIVSACSVGKFSVDNCFGWRFVKNPNGGGIVSFAPTAISFGMVGPEDLNGYDTLLCLNVFNAYKEKQTTTIGQVWSKALTSYINNGMSDPAADLKTIEMYEMFGDPTLAIADDLIPPNKPQTPTGPNTGSTHIEYSYSTKTTDPNSDDQLWYNFSFGDNTFSGWIGPFAQNAHASVSHQWIAAGTYDIKVSAKDTHDVLSVESDPLTVIITGNENLPPPTPSVPIGPTNGEVKIAYTFTTAAVTDPDGDQVLYNFSFADGTFSGWISNNYSTHSWNNAGTYEVKVKAKDTHQAQSDWSPALTITILSHQPAFEISFEGGTGFTVSITNTGDNIATNISYNIEIIGGLYVTPRKVTDKISKLSIGETENINVNVFGIGFGILIKPLPKIRIKILCDQNIEIEKEVNVKIKFKTIILE
ncbi:MAG: C25 family cysteine peptidase [Candidatus Thermoplasmatota archaeon]